MLQKSNNFMRRDFSTFTNYQTIKNHIKIQKIYKHFTCINFVVSCFLQFSDLAQSANWWYIWKPTSNLNHKISWFVTWLLVFSLYFVDKYNIMKSKNVLVQWYLMLQEIMQEQSHNFEETWKMPTIQTSTKPQNKLLSNGNNKLKEISLFATIQKIKNSKNTSTNTEAKIILVRIRQQRATRWCPESAIPRDTAMRIQNVGSGSRNHPK